MNKQEPQRLNSESWAKFGERLLNKNDTSPQIEFLRACRSKDSFDTYVSNRLQTENSKTGSSIVFPHRFTQNEFYYPPEDTQKTIWETFKDFPHESMSDVCFWGHVMLDLIKNDSFEPAWLAANSGGISEDGEFVIDMVLKSPEEVEKIDKCVRRILRSMCNPQPRGKRIVYFDFPLGKSWWRYYWADKMSKHIDLDFKCILEIMDLSSYQALAERMHSNRSYISFPNVFGGILLFLDKTSDSVNSKTIGKIANGLAYLIIWNSIEMQKPNLVCEQINNIYESIRQNN